MGVLKEVRYRTLHLTDKFQRNDLIVSNSRLRFISPESVDILAKSWMFF